MTQEFIKPLQSYSTGTQAIIWNRRAFKFLQVVALFCFLLSGAFAQTTLNPSSTVNVTMTQGQAFSDLFRGIGSIENTYTLRGTLPPGISLATVPASPPATSNHDMRLSGTPTTSGTFSFDVDVGATLSVAVTNYSTTISVTVLPAPPTANNVNQTVTQNSASNVITTSTTGSITSLTVVSTPAHGTANASGTTITYTPNAGYLGSDTFNYQAIGPGGSSSIATINITVAGAAPTVSASSFTVNANSTSNTLTPTITGSATSLVLVSTPSHGSANVSGLNIIYSPAAGYSGNDTFSIKANGPGGTSSTVTQTVTVLPPAPTVNSSSVTVNANSTNNTIAPTITGAATSITITSLPAHGSATVSGLTVIYTPSAGYNGNDAMTITATGAGGTSPAASINITVTPPPPSASSLSATVAANSTNNTISPVIVGTASSLTIVTPPSQGTATISGMNVLYTPNTAYNGTDSFKFAAQGPGGTSNTATANITVLPPAPSVAPSSSSVSANSSGNIITPSITGSATSISIVSAPVHGSATVSGLTVIYTPTAGYNGSDSIGVTATGPGGSSTAATLTITVIPPAPVASASSTNVTANTSSNLITPVVTGVATSLAISSSAAHGVVVIAGMNVKYTPNTGYSGPDSFEFTATGPGGVSNSASISINVIAAAVPPTASNSAQSVAANSSNNVLSPTIGGVITGLSILTPPAHGTAATSSLQFIYTPSAGFVGTDTIVFNASGPSGTSTNAEITITVLPPAPVARSSNITVQANSINFSITPDIEGTATSLNVMTPPNHGNVTSSGISFNYTPANGFAGNDSFTFTAIGPGGTSVPATIGISVFAPAPSISFADINVPSNSGSVTVIPTINGIVSSLSLSTPPSHGTAQILGQTVSYTPTAGYSGPDNFAVIAVGPGGSSSPARANITVIAPAPTASNSYATIFANSVVNTLNPSIVGSFNSISIVTPPSHGSANTIDNTVSYSPDSNYTGPDSIVVIAVGPGGRSNSAVISIEVVDATPKAQNSEATVAANSTLNVLPISTSGNLTSLSIIAPPINGNASTQGLSIRYSPNNNYVGPDSLQFIAVGPNGQSTPATVNIRVIQNGVSIDDIEITVVENSNANPIGLRFSGPVTSFSAVSSPAKGKIDIDGLNLSYTPNPSFVGTDQFSISANAAGSSPATATVRVKVIPMVPKLSDGNFRAFGNSTENPIALSVIGSYSTIQIASQPKNGILTVRDRQIFYTPNKDFIGDDNATVFVSGVGGASNIAKLNFAVVIAPITIQGENIKVNANSVANKYTAKTNGQVSAIEISRPPIHGTANVNGLGFVYTPNRNYIGLDSVAIVAIGETGKSAPVEVNIEVLAGIQTLNATVDANSTNNRISLPSVDSSLVLEIAGAAKHGVASMNGGNLTYSPQIDFVGSDEVVIVARNAGLTLSTISIQILVKAGVTTAKNAKITVESGRTISFDLATLVSGPNYGKLSIQTTSTPLHGRILLNGTTLNYTANANFIGEDSVSFVASTIGGTSNSGELSITIIARPDPSKSASVNAIHDATTNIVRHFEQTQIEQFNGRVFEIASRQNNSSQQEGQPGESSCGTVGMWFSGLNSYGSYRGRDGSKYTTMAYSAGADRCFASPDTHIGFGVGYARDHNELPGVGANLTANANSAASYLTSKLIPNVRASFVFGLNQIGNNYQRNDETGVIPIYGQWKGNQFFSSSTVSGEFKLGPLQVSPYLKLDLSNLSLSPYDETGTSNYRLHYHQQSMKSQRKTLGFNSEMTIETKWGVLIPRFRIEIQRDAAKRETLKVNYAEFPDAIYLIPANETDRRMGLMMLGADMNWKGGLVTNFNLTRTSANQNNQNNRINIRFSYKY